jgi:hypothetical protein
MNYFCLFIYICWYQFSWIDWLRCWFFIWWCWYLVISSLVVYDFVGARFWFSLFRHLNHKQYLSIKHGNICTSEIHKKLSLVDTCNTAYIHPRADGVPDFLHNLASMAAICNKEFTPSYMMVLILSNKLSCCIWLCWCTFLIFIVWW